MGKKIFIWVSVGVFLALVSNYYDSESTVSPSELGTGSGSSSIEHQQSNSQAPETVTEGTISDGSSSNTPSSNTPSSNTPSSNTSSSNTSTEDSVYQPRIQIDISAIDSDSEDSIEEKYDLDEKKLASLGIYIDSGSREKLLSRLSTKTNKIFKSKNLGKKPIDPNNPLDNERREEWFRIRNCIALVDYVFHENHPGRNGQKIKSDEIEERKEWNSIQSKLPECV